MVDETYDMLAEAILHKRQVILEYHGRKREVCPHTLGEKDEKKRVLVYQFAGESNTDLPEGGKWRCLDVDKVTILEVKEGEWFTGDSHTRPQTCIDHVEVEVEY